MHYQQLKQAFHDSHEQRRQAAAQYVNSRTLATGADGKRTFQQANENFNAVRQEAVEFVRQTNEESSFNDVNYVFPLFVLQNMPTGLVGLIVAAILAAAMSSVAAELCSLSTATTIDFYARHVNPQGTDRELLRFARLSTFVWGLFSCVVATFVTNLGSHRSCEYIWLFFLRYRAWGIRDSVHRTQSECVWRVFWAALWDAVSLGCQFVFQSGVSLVQCGWHLYDRPCRRVNKLSDEG